MADRATEALEAGRTQAAEVIRRRRARLRTRQSALLEAPERAREMRAPTGVRSELAEALGPRSSRVLVAEGDSWFDYPWTDVLSELEDRHGYRVESVSHWGDRIEAMAYEGGQLDGFVRTLEELLRNGREPEAILLSGGGNDVAGEFAMLLNHFDSPEPGLNEQVVAGLVDQRIRYAYITVLSAVTSVCEDHLGAALPILIHGYDYSVPDGRGFWGGWGPLPGPWLDPGFRKKGYRNEAERKTVVAQLIDRFNVMLMGIAGMLGLEHVRHVDLRGTLRTDASYQDWWDNELHPTAAGFEEVARKFASVLTE